MQANMWLSYGDLAWTESIITSPGDYAEETDFYVNIIKENSEIEAKTLLHVGCGKQGLPHRLCDSIDYMATARGRGRRGWSSCCSRFL